MAASDKAGVPRQDQYIRQEGGLAGLCSPDLPWVAMRVKERIGFMKAKKQDAEKLFRTRGAAAYEEPARTIYGLLREAWEQGIVEVLLGEIVERYRPSIETKRVRDLHDITETDCAAIETGMSECSRWIRGHDQAAADGTPFPLPADLERRIQEFETWVATIRKRRK